MQLFAAQTRPGGKTTHSLRAGQHLQSKRKRDEDDWDDEHEIDGRSPSLDAVSYSSSHAHKTAQLRVAGLLPENAAEIPPTPFPHAPARTPSHPLNASKLWKGLAELDPPLFAVNATSNSSFVGGVSEPLASRQKHLGLLSAVMHRCLLEGDFHRAGKAWGLILRTHIAGVPIDPRNHGRWGIGAEILLRRGHRPTQSKLDNNANEESSFGEESFSEEGFELAKEYYERLIIQHPHRKHITNVIDELTFYPAMFSLWIYEISEKSARMRRTFEESDQGMDDGITGLEERRAHRSAIIAYELQHARQITARLDQLIVSPPFDKSPDLLQLRGMLALWIGDLILKSDEPHHDNGSWDNLLFDEDLSMESTDPGRERLQRLIDSRREYRQAMDSFVRAQVNGRGLGDVLANTEERILDLSRKIAKFEPE
ncbi:uncharacterized protein EI97DRAFT_67867 [Westerdykella ornata]|uniref:Uncharacterized protein n=1 Tax=Westerdykella ornata TaxID=318751 RepID=A0A6A6JH21_WESOR|nr:uncharacterized protein EI97DRAFT_67867 [Westerdykella ornata]KAF2275657.1 hypothetical protein EI97DRAFT_67867 [Westerdykella ornata]